MLNTVRHPSEWKIWELLLGKPYSDKTQVYLSSNMKIREQFSLQNAVQSRFQPQLMLDALLFIRPPFIPKSGTLGEFHMNGEPLHM